MADDIKSKRVKPNPSTGTISGDISKFVLNPLKNLFKDERKNQVEEEAIVQGEEQNVYEPEEVKLDQKDLNKLVKLAVVTDTTAADTSKLKKKLEQDKKTSPWVDYLTFAAGAPKNLSLLNKETKTQIADKLAASNSDIVKISDTNYVNTKTGYNEYNEIGRNKFAEQAINGALEAGYSFGQLITMGSDLIFDTDLTRKLDDVHDDWYNKLQLEEPTDLGGQLTKTIVEYGLPIGFIGKLSKPIRAYAKSKASKIQNKALRYGTKAGLSIGYNAAIFGATEFIVGNRGDTIKAPFSKQYQFEGEEGKSGRELALARIKNKVRFGYEGAKIGGTWGLVGRAVPLGLKLGLKTVGKTFDLGTRVANTTVFNPMSKLLSGQVPFTGGKIPYTKITVPVIKYSDKLVPQTVSKLSGGIRTGSKFLTFKAVEPLLRGVKVGRTKKGIPKLEYTNKGKLPAFDEWKLFSTTNADPFKARLAKIAKYVNLFTKEYRTPDKVYKLQTNVKLNIKGENRTVAKYIDDLESRAYKLVQAQAGVYNKGPISPLAIQNQLDIVTAYLKNQAKLKSLPKELRASAEGLKKHIDTAKSEYLKLLPKGELRNEFAKIIKNYMKQSFAVVTNPLYNPPKEIVARSVKAFRKIMDKNKDMREESLQLFPAKSRNKSMNDYAEAAIRTMVTDYKSFTGNPLEYFNKISRELLRKDKLMLTGEELPKVFRELLGQEKNLRSEVLQTVVDLVSQVGNKKLYDEIAQIGLKNGWLKSQRGTLETQSTKIGQLPGLGYLKSNISNLYAAPPFVQALKGSQGLLDALLKNNVYRGMLQYKTAVQFGKTGLSPDTQIRNVTSTPLFPLGYGWVGNKGTIDDAFKFIYQDITGAGSKKNTPQFIEEVGKYIKLGGLDESIEAQELLAVVKKLSENPNIIDRYMRRGLNTKVIDKATQFYQAGDNVWKLYAIRWNKNNLSEIFKGNLKELRKQEELITGEKYNPISKLTGKTKTYDEAVEELSVWYARNLMPTYSLVPEIIKFTRMAPVGNFISWPSEILRLTTTAFRTALREASSDNLAIQQQGLRKAIGMSLTFGGAAYVGDKVYSAYTGVDNDMIEAYKRSFAYDYDRNAKFTAVKPLEDNVLTIVNSSYSDVWDYVKRPIRAFLNQIGKTQSLKEIDDQALKALGDGAIELLQPFTSTSLGIEPMLDVLAGSLGGRGGKTKNGFNIYSPETDSWPTIAYKSMKHIFRAAAPGAILQADKYGNLAYRAYEGRTFPNEVIEALISSLTGRKIRRVDLLELLNRKAGQLTPTLKGDLTMSEGFYRFSDWETRGPKQVARQYQQIQEEAFVQQQKVLQFVEDARTLKIPDYKIEEVLTRRFRNKELVSNLMYTQEFTPFGYYQGLFEDRYNKALRDSKKQNRPAPNYNFVVPINELETVKSNNYGLDLNISYSENMKKKAERNKEFEKRRQEQPPKDDMENILNLLKQQEAKIKTPPLPKQPEPVAAAAALPKIDPVTQLTSTETALLSPDEQAIRLKQRGIA